MTDTIYPHHLGVSRNGEVRLRTQTGYIRLTDNPIGYVSTIGGRWVSKDAKHKRLTEDDHRTRHEALREIVDKLNGDL